MGIHRSLPAVLAAVLLALPLAAETVPATRAEVQLTFAPLVRAAAPAVVNIYATRIVADRVNPFAADPFFRDFFGDLGRAQPRVQNALGSGVILTGDGLVVSNYHVVGGAQDIRVVLADRREFAADLVLSDEESDLAVLRLRDAAALPVLELADSDAAQVGDLVLAIGNPFGVGQTVTSGIVSALGRSTLSLGSGRGYFLQTDAAVNPGNSGGALIDMQGRLLGINTAILTRGGGSNGVGFAIPANLVARVLDQARAGAARFTRPWAGIGGQGVDPGLAEALGLAAPEGVVITDLHPESPFAAAGLRPGDVILTLGGQPVNSPQEVMFRLAVAGTGASTTLGYARDGQTRDTEVALIPPPVGDRDETAITGDVALRGLTVARIDPALIAEHGLPFSASGTLVTDARDRAARAGLRPGDILVAINGQPVRSPGDVARLSGDRPRLWQVEALREGQRVILRFRF
ncbi:MAG: trypsin-like peptidase domain-containing protein [Paracoccaceae bacterium]|nr:MAG: trypsin-like peptidase domain-containing protein [Paracoccaceae bacterium]